MAIDIVKVEPRPPHNCMKEIAPNTVFGQGWDSNDKLPRGLITRCSCGTLWTTVYDVGEWNKWVRAGFWLRRKYRDDGWEGVNNESY